MSDLSTVEREVCAAVESRRDRLLTELAEHVAIPTGTGWDTGVEAYRNVLLDRLQALGATVEHVPGEARPEWLLLPHAADGSGAPPATSIAARPSADGTPPSILLAGHLDTVHDPHGDFRTLTVADDGRTATGPGAADMKGGILIAVTALECLQEIGSTMGWSMLLNPDEEIGSFQSAHALRAAAARHRIGVALEPALPDGSLVVERMGTGMFRVDVHGRSAHVGREYAKGVSAVYELARKVLDLEGMVDLERGRIVNVGPLEGGPVVNAVPDLARCWGNVRYRDTDAQQALQAAVDDLATAPDAMPRVEIHTAFNRPAKPLTPAVQTMAETARTAAEALGQSLPFASTGGVCDGNILQEVGLPTLDTLGVRGGNLHRTDEFIEVASLVERCQLLAVLLLRFDRLRLDRE